MTYWNGNLLNKPKDIAIDSILTVLLILTYIPQHTIITTTDIHPGLSSSYLAFNALHSTAELANTLLWAAYVWPNGTNPVLQDETLRGWKALGGLMGVAQLGVLCFCDLTLIFDDPRAKWLKLLVLLEIIIILLPAAIIAFPRPKKHSWEIDFVLALLSFAIPPIMLISIPTAFLAQIWSMQVGFGELYGLEIVGMGFQALTLGALAARWLKRLGTFPDPKQPLYGGDEERVPLWLWYTWGMPAINLATRALSTTLLCVYALWQTK